MSATLIRGCDVVVTMDDAGTEIAGGSILARDGVIEWVGPGEPSSPADEVIDGTGTVAVPGLVNTHHHLFQVMTRARAQRFGLFGWLTELYPVWAGLDEEWTGVAASVGLAELALSGCATSTDHHYVFPAGAGDLLGAEVDAARRVGLRFHPCRGSMDLGVSGGGLPPDSVVQDRDVVLAETEAAVDRFHDPEPGAMLRIAVGPCSPFTATPELIRESAMLARARGVRLHTHIAETVDEDAFCRETFGQGPVELLEDLGFLGPDVWLAHAVHLSDADIARIAAAGTGVASCPSSNLRLGSGIAPVRELLDAGAPVGVGVDGSASNDGGNLLGEVRQAMLVARARGDPAALSARDALRLATRGGAACLGRDDVGAIEPGRRADIALFAVDDVFHAGAEADPVAGLVFCAPQRVRDLIVEGRRIVEGGGLVTVDEDAVAADGHRMARRIAGGPAAPAPQPGHAEGAA
jgi:cytosine/adenosine deaminase-related metal-dependent hydrolase